MNLSESVYQPIFDNYGENAWVVLPVFIKEMDTCFISLEKSLHRIDLHESRQVLHQMIGASKIMHVIEIEEELLTLQGIVKSPDFPRNCNDHLTKIKSQVNELFKYSIEHRKAYNLYLLYRKEDTFKRAQALVDEKTQLSLSYGISLADCISYLSSNEPGIIMTDFQVGSVNLEKLSAYLQSSFNNSPVLLIVDQAEGKTQESQKEYINVSGSLVKTATINQWFESIKTVANGRDSWQEKELEDS
jgi:hypothetical protein